MFIRAIRVEVVLLQHSRRHVVLQRFHRNQQDGKSPVRAGGAPSLGHEAEPAAVQCWCVRQSQVGRLIGFRRLYSSRLQHASSSCSTSIAHELSD